MLRNLDDGLQRSRSLASISAKLRRDDYALGYITLAAYGLLAQEHAKRASSRIGSSPCIVMGRTFAHVALLNNS